ncbi:hypothetical protein ACIPWE_34930 [Streptomyces sp. NPDC090073]|uniref:hypothetical protein n=1 Tax=Streptomyces sp. NPDC090073 TaxID=3365936 RepID=UPI003808DAB3
MSEALEKAEAAAREAAANTVDVAQIVATVLATQQLTQQPTPAPLAPARQEFDTKKWVTIGGLSIAAGLVASLFAIAVAIGAVSVAILALVLRGLWRDYVKGK